MTTGDSNRTLGPRPCLLEAVFCGMLHRLQSPLFLEMQSPHDMPQGLCKHILVQLQSDVFSWKCHLKSLMSLDGFLHYYSISHTRSNKRETMFQSLVTCPVERLADEAPSQESLCYAFLASVICTIAGVFLITATY